MKIEKPTLIVDQEICRQNIATISAKAKLNHLIFRPHFKTHQSAEIGELFKAAEVDKITVSSVDMAEYYASKGWDDITIAVPVNLYELHRVNTLGKEIKLQIILDNVEIAKYLRDYIQIEIGVFIKIDVGNHRCGLDPSNILQISTILNELDKNENILFKGFLGHAGHSYLARNKEEIIQIHQQSLKIMKELKAIYKSKYPELITSLGDTPTISINHDFGDIDEIRPGNFIFYDAMQLMLGSCTPANVACYMACPVISKNEKRCEIVIYGGAIHLSKEAIHLSETDAIYGLLKPNPFTNEIIPLEEAYIHKLFQEHGIIKAGRSLYNKIKVGDMIGIIPIHSCLTVAAMKQYTLLNGTTVNTWDIK